MVAGGACSRQATRRKNPSQECDLSTATTGQDEPTPIRLNLSFPGSRVYAHDTELPADWYLDSRYGSLGDYVKHQVLPNALAEAGLKVDLVFPAGATGVTADAIEAQQGFGANE